MKEKTMFIASAIIIVLLIASVVGYFSFISKGGSDSLLTVGGVYDSNGNLIKQGFSVVGGVEGVKYITLKINVLNKDTVPLTFSVTSLSPAEVTIDASANTTYYIILETTLNLAELSAMISTDLGYLPFVISLQPSSN